MTSSPNESSFMAAAGKNIKDLQTAVLQLQQAASNARADAQLAKIAATEAREESSRWKTITRGIGVVVLVALIASGLSIYNWAKAQDSTNQLRHQAVTSCEIGNQQRAASVETWEKNFSLQADESKATGSLLTELVATLANNDPKRIAQINAILAQSSVAAAAEQKAFLTYVRQVNAPRNCAQAYQGR